MIRNGEFFCSYKDRNKIIRIIEVTEKWIEYRDTWSGRWKTINRKAFLRFYEPMEFNLVDPFTKIAVKAGI